MTDVAALLPYQRTLLSELVPTPENPRPLDALLILARGLGLRAIIANLLKVYDTSDQLVLVLNATEEEERGLQEETGLRLKTIDYEMPAAMRQDLYKGGGICSVTSRILVVDMLTKKVPVELLTGIVVFHAESVTPTSLESFIVRIYRDFNKTGFLMAFSDQPELFSFGMSPLQTVLTQLKIRTVHIWPRFRDEVSKDLVKRKADVVELHQPLSDSMTDIQTSIIECMEATLSEIKRSNYALDVEDLTVENALFRTFDAVVRAQLDPVWHTVGPKTKQLVSDLTTLRKLQAYLLAFDCVSFNRFLETILTSNSVNPFTGAQKVHQSPWLFTTAADTIFSVARERVYRQKKIGISVKQKPVEGNSGSSTAEKLRGKKPVEQAEEEIPDDLAEEDFDQIDEQVLREMENFNAPTPLTAEESRIRQEEKERLRGLPPGVEPVLEEQPKWKLLSEVLEEIETELYFHEPQEDEVANNTILVMCSSASICSTLREYIVSQQEEEGGQIMLREKLRDYFWWKTSLGKMHKNLKRSRGGSWNAGPKSGPNPVETEGGVEIVSKGLKKKFEMRGAAGPGGAPRGKRRRMRGGGNVGATTERVGLAATTGSDGAALEAEAGNLADIMEATSTDIAAPSYVNMTEHVTESFDPVDFDTYFGLLANETLVIIRPYTGDDDDKVLEELRPKYVVMYDPDPAFVRRIETFRAAHQGMSIRVYFLMYKDSVEEQRYLSSIRKEKDAFTRLIREKTTMAIPHEAEYRAGEDDGGELLRVFSSRIGGGKKVSNEVPRVIVDVREFRSSLPCLLHAGAFDVVPVTITIGDYILTPEICVERKSLPDLISSFNSGRLYQQCELMTAHYKQPILLIEFDEKKSFNLEAYAEPKAKGSDQYTSDSDLRSKLVLLTISFPRLRTIWSSSPYQTVEIFRDLKENRAEPEAAKAILVGADETTGGLPGEGEAEYGFNITPQEILRNLPGVTTGNFRYVMSRVGNLEGLCALELGDLQDIIGVEAGRTLERFVNRNITVKE